MVTIVLLQELLKTSNPHFCCLCLISTDSEDGSMQLSEDINLDLENSATSVAYMIKCVLQQEDFISTYVCNSCIISTINAYRFIVTCSQVTSKLTKLIDGVTSDLQQLDRTQIENSWRLFISTDINTTQSRLHYDTKNQLQYSKDNSKIPSSLTTFQATSNPEPPQKFQCESCGFAYRKKEALINHINNNCNRTQCDICGVLIFNRCLNQHKQACVKQLLIVKETNNTETHSSQRRHTCERCGKNFRLLKFYKRHRNGSCRKPCTSDPLEIKLFKCNNCRSEYSVYSSLKMHMKIHSDNKNDYHECGWCQKRFLCPAQLTSHIVKHTKEKNWTCDTCGGKFVTRASLTYHIRTHTGEKPYKCKFCEQTFESASRRLDHEKSRHLPLIQCQFCYKWYKQSRYRQHYRQHLAINSDSVPPKSSALRDQLKNKPKNGNSLYLSNSSPNKFKARPIINKTFRAANAESSDSNSYFIMNDIIIT